MSQPNLFSYATSELSQDAFICWLLSWASPEFKNSDKDLHKCAISLIEALFDKHKISVPPKIEKVDITKQDKNIDVLCVINDIYPILIEDKTGTKNHSDQLKKYFEEVKIRDYKEENIIPIYFKTQDQSSYSDVIKEKYQPFLREDFLNILKTYQGTNAILVDYRGYLQSISDKVERYQSTKIAEWDWYAWTGFYLELQKRLERGDWDYVANPAGGFLGFWWHFQKDENCEQYLQLEEDKFCFKIWVKDKEERKRLRSKWHKAIQDEAKDRGLNLVKPSRFGIGKSMTVCVFAGEYRKTKDGIIDLDKTIMQLKEAEKLLKSLL
jgi:predicted CopG family antitoxin